MSEFYEGNIVRWSNELWIVVEDNVEEKKIELISAEGENVRALVTANWPKQKDKRYSSVKFVASSMKDFFDTRVRRAFRSFR